MESKDLWADRVLGYIVQSYIQVYDIGDIQKQELCSLLGWDLKKIK